MPQFRVTALEKFLVQTVYIVTAECSEEAEALCKNGSESYQHLSVDEGDEEWIETLSVDPQ